VCSDLSPDEQANLAVDKQTDECKIRQKALDKIMKDKSATAIEVCLCVLVPINIVPRWRE
jgi:hypothetical protein